MTNTKRSLTATTVAAIAAVAAMPALIDAKASSGASVSSARTQTLRLFDHPEAIVLTTSDGNVTAHPPYPQPQSGDTLDVYSLDYVGNHRHHARQWTLSNHLRCTFTEGPPDCVSNLAVGSSLLVFHGNKLIGATGHYRGATGRVLSNTQVPGAANASDIVARIRRPAPTSPRTSQLNLTPTQREQLESYQQAVARLFGVTSAAAAPTTAQVLRSLSVPSRRYVEAITTLTATQLAAGFGTGK